MIPVVWIAAGAAVMYFLDPEKGEARRSQMRGKLDQFRTEHPELMQTAEGKTVHLRNRAKGLFYETRSKIEGAIDPSSAPNASGASSSAVGGSSGSMSEPASSSKPLSSIDYSAKETSKEPDTHRAV